MDIKMTTDNKKKIAPAPVVEPNAPVVEDKFTRAEWEAVRKAKHGEKLNQILRGFGLIAVILFYLIAVELLFEPSLFGLIFTPSEFHAFWYFVKHTGEVTNAISDETAAGAALIENQKWVTAIAQDTTIFDDWLQWGTWFPVAFLTVIEIAITVGVAYITAYSIRDIFGIVKNLFRSAKGTVVEIGSVVKDNFDEEMKSDKKPSERKKKSKKEKEEDFNKELNKVIDEPKAKAAPVKVEKAEDLDDDTLDALLSYPHTHEEEKLVDSLNNSSATAPRNRIVDR